VRGEVVEWGAAEGDGAAIGAIEAGDDIEKCGFAAVGFAEDGGDGAVFEREGGAVERDLAAELAKQAGDLQRCGHGECCALA